MTATMTISAALGVGGIIVSGLIYAFGPRSNEIGIWDVGFVAGISTIGLGVLGALVETVTTA